MGAKENMNFQELDTNNYQQFISLKDILKIKIKSIF